MEPKRVLSGVAFLILILAIFAVISGSPPNKANSVINLSEKDVLIIIK